MDGGQIKTVRTAQLYSAQASHAAIADETLSAPQKTGILCVGGSAAIRDHLAQIKNTGWKIVLIADPDPDSASRVLRENGEIHVAMIGLDMDNVEAAAELASSHAELEWIALVEHSDLKHGRIRQVISSLFFDYHTLPVDADRLLVALGHASGMAKLRSRGSDDASLADDEAYYHDIVGVSEGMRSVYSTIEKAAPTNFPVLITGKSGTGKELVAKAIQSKSDRAGRPFVVMNCGGIVPTLIQSELFGHEKGSFTGADKTRQGHFEAAHGGTIFFDEIGELPLEIQANLLRALEEGEIRRVGGSSSIPADVRVIAATNRDLSQAVADGKFREDLLYRLTVIHIEIPPLCERQSDIEILANYYLRKLKLETRSNAKGFSRRAIDAMRLHDWPGNVRELINRIKSAALLTETPLIKPEDLGLTSPCSRANNDGFVDNAHSLKAAKEDAERKVVTRTLQEVDFNISLAAQRLGVSRVGLYNIMKKYELR